MIIMVKMQWLPSVIIINDERAWFKKRPQWSKSNRYAELEVWIFI